MSYLHSNYDVFYKKKLKAVNFQIEDEPIRTDVCKLCGKSKYEKGYTYSNGEWECKHCEEEIASMRAKQPSYIKEVFWEKIDKNGHGYNCCGKQF